MKKCLMLPVFCFKSVPWVLFWLLILLSAVAMSVGLSESLPRIIPERIIIFGLGGFLIGWLSSGWVKKPWLVLTLILFSGVAMLSLGTTNTVFNLVKAAWATLPALPYGSGQAVQMESLQPSFRIITNAAVEFLQFISRFGQWFSLARQSTYLFDPVLSNFLWGLIAWLAFGLCGWLMRWRKHALIACLPLLSLMIGVLGYTQFKPLGLTFLLCTIIPLTVLLELIKREHGWDAEKTDYSEELRGDLAGVAIPVLVIILACAAAIPTLSLQKIKTFFDDLFSPAQQSSEMIEALGVVQAPFNTGETQTTRGEMPTSTLLSGSPDLETTEIMRIKTNDPKPPPPIAGLEIKPIRYYWVGATYDQYTGTGWETSIIYPTDKPAGTQLLEDALTDGRLLVQSIRKTPPTNTTLYLTGLPVQVNAPILLKNRIGKDYFSATTPATSYQGITKLPIVTEDALRNASDAYPYWVSANHLNYPDDLPERVIELAEEITTDAANTYDKARAIEKYLRATYPYSLAIDPPPPNQDVVDYFLFELQTGYCDYYATAMVVLLRTQGIPARFVSGYTSGSYDYEHGEYIIRAINAHAWVEVWFADIGWIAFEPTASEPEIARETTLPEYDAATQTQPELTLPPIFNWQWIATRPTMLILLGVLVLFLLAIINRIQLAIHKNMPAAIIIPTLYRKLTALSSQLQVQLSPSMTPHEVSQVIIACLQNAKSKWVKRQFDQYQADITLLIALYIQVNYSPCKPAKKQVAHAVVAWRRSRQTLIMAYILRQFR